MRTIVAAFFAACTISLLVVPVALATPAVVNVRIEGETETLFEGPILTDGHNVRGLTDSAAPPQGHRCNGLNNNHNPTAGPTPTAASVDAMNLLGLGFDGDWYPDFDDYFLTQWGPDREDIGAGEYWGVLVNNVFTNIGGCQYKLDAGDEVLWVYDAFQGRSRISLYPGGYSGAGVTLTAQATLGVPFEVEVDSWDGYNESEPPPAPTRSTTGFEGAEVAPVTTASNGFQQVETGSPASVFTGADGKASITFTAPGWHRIKATVSGSGGAETVIRSNRLDVCVPEPPATGCGAAPADDSVRTPPPPKVEGEEDGEGEKERVEQPQTPSPSGTESPSAAVAGRPSQAEPARAQVRVPQLNRRRVAQGLVGVSWRVLDPGVGIAGWTIASQRVGRQGARYVTRATGTRATAATLRLPPGATYRLRFTVTDLLGRGASTTIGRVEVPAQP
jgi:hypothetical protein